MLCTVEKSSNRITHLNTCFCGWDILHLITLTLQPYIVYVDKSIKAWPLRKAENYVFLFFNLVWDTFSSVYATLPCVLTWHVWPCVMSRCGRVHMAYDSRFARGILANHSSFSLPFSSSFPPSYFFFFPIIGYHLSPLPPDSVLRFILLLSNYLYLTLGPSGQHGWLVSCQQSKWGMAGISWPFYCGRLNPSKDPPQWRWVCSCAVSKKDM